MKVIGLLNKKGGAGKTTTAIGLTMGMQARGLRVALVDTDPNESATHWLETVPEIDHSPCDTTMLAEVLDGVVDDYDVLVIDSAPNDPASISEIARWCDIVLVPLAPSMIEVDQLADTIDLIAASRTPWRVVPVRVRLSTASGQSIRAMCEELGVPVTRSIVPLSEAVARSFGELPPHLSFVSLVDEILGELELVSA